MKLRNEKLQLLVISILFLSFAHINLSQAQSAELCQDIGDFVPEIVFDTEYFENQIASYDTSIENDSLDPELYALRGDANYSLREFESALSDFEQAIELDPNYAYAYARLGDVHQKIFDYPTAFEQYTRAIDINPEYAYAYVKRGIVVRKLAFARDGQVDSQEYLIALEDFDKAYELDPSLILTLGRRSEAYIELGEIGLALKDAQTAVELNSMDPFTYVVLGNAYRFAGRNEDALESFQKALELESEQSSTYAYAFTSRGELCRRLGNLAQASWDIEQALEIDPTFSWAYFVASRVADNRQLYDLAAENLLNAIEYNPIDPYIYELLDDYDVDVELYQDKLDILLEWTEFVLPEEEGAGEEVNSDQDSD